ncbi:uncharacterized protein LOC144499583 [Mustelus asterias]
MLQTLFERSGLKTVIETLAIWCGYKLTPRSRFAILYDFMYNLLSFLWTTNLGIVILVIAILLIVWGLVVLIMKFVGKFIQRKKEKEKKKSLLKSVKSTTAHYPRCKRYFRKMQKRLKKAETWKNPINESTEIEQELEIDKCVPLRKYKRGLHRMKKKQRNAREEFDKSKFEEGEGALNEKALHQSSNEIPLRDHHRHCGKDTSLHSFGSVTSEKLSYKKSSSVSDTSSLNSALNGGGKSCIASSDLKQKCPEQNLFENYTSIGTNTSDQFSSEEMWRMTPSITWRSTDEQCTVTSNTMDKYCSGPRSKTALKEADSSSYKSEKYSVSPSQFRKDEALMSKITGGEDAKMARSR